jgi:uncharacterized repeat protein (TIGR01451 family)
MPRLGIYKVFKFKHNLWDYIMKRFSKQFAIALTTTTIVALPLVSQPVMAGIQQAGQTIAQVMQRPNVQLNLSAEKLVGNGEKASWQALKGNVTVNPNDTLRYTVMGQNTGKAAAKKLTMTQPIPKQMTYKLGSSQNTAQAVTTYSIDNGKSFTAQPLVKVKLADGQEAMRPAPAEAYTHVRWQFGNAINPNSQVKASYEVKVR